MKTKMIVATCLCVASIAVGFFAYVRDDTNLFWGVVLVCAYSFSMIIEERRKAQSINIGRSEFSIKPAQVALIVLVFLAAFLLAKILPQ
jgi:hypothetical protein